LPPLKVIERKALLKTTDRFEPSDILHKNKAYPNCYPPFLIQELLGSIQVCLSQFLDKAYDIAIYGLLPTGLSVLLSSS
jgi:hypothetical protein